MVNHPNRSKRRGPNAIMEFITTSTGSITMARRSTVDDYTMDMADALVDTGRDGPWSINLYARIDNRELFILVHEENVVSIGLLCLARSGYEAAWTLAEQTAPEAVVLHRPRRAPWFAVAIEPAAILLPGDLLRALSWLEIAIAWRLLSDYEAGIVRGLRQPPPKP